MLTTATRKPYHTYGKNTTKPTKTTQRQKPLQNAPESTIMKRLMVRCSCYVINYIGRYKDHDMLDTYIVLVGKPLYNGIFTITPITPIIY